MPLNNLDIADKPVRVLVLGFQNPEAESLIQALEKTGIPNHRRWAQSLDEFGKELRHDVDVILIWWTVSFLFSPREAISIVRESDSDIPVIFLADPDQEKIALEAVEAGAADYLFSDRMGRLGLAIRNALRSRIPQGSDSPERIPSSGRAEETAGILHQVFHEFAEHLREALWITTPGMSEILYANQACETIWGKSCREFSTNPESFWNSIVTEDRSSLKASLSRETPSAADLEYRIIRPDGSVRWIRDRIFPIRDASGHVYQLARLAADITERKMVEDAITHERNFSRTLIDYLPDFIYAKDLNGRYTVANLAMALSVGITSPDQVIGKTDFDLYPSDQAKNFRKDDLAVIQSGQRLINREEWVPDQQETLRWVLTTKVPFCGPDGQIAGLIGISRDISEKKRVHETLRKTEEIYRRAISAANAVPYQLDYKTNTFIFVGDGILQMTGYSPREMTPQLWSSLTRECFMGGETSHLPLDEAIRRTRAGEFSHWQCDSLIESRNGSLRWISDTSVETRNDLGKPDGSVGILIDITERKQAEEALKIRADQQAAVAELGQRALSRPSLFSLMDETASLVRRILDVNYCSILEFLPEENQFVLRAGGFNETCVGETRVAVGTESQAGYTMASKAPVIVENMRAEKRFKVPVLAWDHALNSSLSVVISGQERDYGVLTVFSTASRNFLADDIHLLQSIANMLAMSVGDYRAEMELLQRNMELAALNRIGQSLSKLADSTEILELIYTMIGQILDNTSVFIALYDEENQRLTFPIYLIGGQRIESSSLSRAFQNGLTEHVIRTRTALLINNNLRETTSRLGIQLFGENSLSLLAVPMIFGERIVGVIAALDYDKENAYKPSHLSLLSTFAGQAAIALENARLYSAVQQELAERRRAEAQVQEQARLLDLARDAIVVRNLEDRVLYWNKGAERLYGWPASTALQKKITELVHLETEAFEAARQKLLATGQWAGELRERTNAGNDLTVSSRWTLVYDAEGQPKSILVINTDITEQKRIEAQFLRAQRMESIGRLASGIAHDLNNILSPSLMATQILRMKPLDDEAKRLVTTIETSTRRGASIVKQVLTFARGIDGERVPIQIKHLVRDVVKIAQGTFPKSINIRSRTTSDLWAVIGDATQLHQVLLNLCVNSRDAMPNGGDLMISASNQVLDETFVATTPEAKSGPYIVLEISDKGTGIPQEIQDKIFDPFFTTKELGKGTGLGLSTVLGIVKSHAGLISVQSEMGRGTTFKIHLPATPNEQAQKAESISQNIPRGNGEVVLVVDDEASIREVTHKILSKHGYEVLVAINGFSGAALFKERRDSIKLVLTDIMMPQMDGLALIKELRKVDTQIQIIASSGLGSGPGPEAKTEQLRALNVTTLLTKPYTAETLLSAVRSALKASL